MAEPVSTVVALISAARSANDARKYIDRYAQENGISREEAVRRLSKEAKRRGSKQANRYLRDYREHLAWRRRHPVKGAISNALDPTGLVGGSGRRVRRWLKKSF
jgi:hypothetical protein